LCRRRGNRMISICRVVVGDPIIAWWLYCTTIWSVCCVVTTLFYHQRMINNLFVATTQLFYDDIIPPSNEEWFAWHIHVVTTRRNNAIVSWWLHTTLNDQRSFVAWRLYFTIKWSTIRSSRCPGWFNCLMMTLFTIKLSTNNLPVMTLFWLGLDLWLLVVYFTWYYKICLPISAYLDSVPSSGFTKSVSIFDGTAAMTWHVHPFH
jgi:hypothetical protein